MGRLSRVIDRWICTACLCLGLNIDEQQQSRFVYDSSIYQVQYSWNLLFGSGAVQLPAPSRLAGTRIGA
jgi:hypothetical protein